MFTTISHIFKIEELRKKVIFTLLMLLIYRLGAFVPVPGINKAILQQFMSSSSDILGMFNVFAGGALKQFSIFAMGIMPYITSSIIVQLLSMDVIPKFAEWAKQGEEGRRKLAQITRYGTIILAFIQAIGLSVAFNNFAPGIISDASWLNYLFIALILTAGTAFLMWLGEQITENGIGNGISILIFAGIVAQIPSAIGQIYATQIQGAGDQLFINILKVILILIGSVLIVVGVVFIQQAVRKLPIQYAKRVVGRKMYGGQTTHLPIKINSAGVIPVIFAVSLIMFPPSIARIWPNSVVSQWVINVFDYTHPFGMTLYVLLIVGFTFFYTFVQMNPVQIADNLKNNGGYIPGIRPGKATATYITKVITRLTLTGGLFLAAVAVLPVFFTGITGIQGLRIGGTSLLIVIGVALDTMKQIESHLMKRHYKGFIK